MQTIADLIAAGKLTAYTTRKGAVHLVAAWRETYPRIVAFWSAAAFEQRGRDRERRKLVCELEGLDEQARYDKARRPMLTERLQILAREDIAATLAGVKASACANLQVFGRIKRQPPSSLPEGNFVFCSSDRDALKPDVGNRRFRITDIYNDSPEYLAAEASQMGMTPEGLKQSHAESRRMVERLRARMDAAIGRAAQAVVDESKAWSLDRYRKEP